MGVRLLCGSHVLRTWRGVNKARLSLELFDLSPYAGQTLRVEVFDFATGDWGHVLADHFTLAELNDPPGPSAASPTEASAEDIEDEP